MILGWKWFSILPGHLLKADELKWFAGAQMFDFRFFGISSGWTFIGFAWGVKRKK